MKASEKKIKDPNVYWHEYFREGREDLLWLIQKPQTKAQAAKRKRGDEKREGDSDDEGRRATPEVADGHNLGRVVQSGASNQDLIALPRSDVANLRSEIQRLQRQQGVISKMIAQLKEQNEAFYRQATEFQSQHDRHENSINAILTFLGTFYNKSLESGFNLNNLFGNNNSQHGTVVDVGDGDDAEGNSTHNNQQQLQRYKRPQLLLEDSRPDSQLLQPGKVSTAPNSARSSTSPAQGRQSRNTSSAQAPSPQPPPQASVSPAIKDDADTPNVLSQYPESDEMMSLINAANANTPPDSAPNFDFSSALNHAQNATGNQPLTDQQRTDMLNLIANSQQQAGSSSNSNPVPRQMPGLDQYNRTQEQLEMLQRLQREQDSKVADLAGRLQPLSPNGTIPGFQGDSSGAMGDYGMGVGGDLEAPNSDFDIDAFINSDDNYFAPNYGQGDGTGQGFSSDLRGANGGNTNGNALSNNAFDDDPTGLNFDFGTPTNNAGLGINAASTTEDMKDLFGDDDVNLTVPSPTGSYRGQDGGGRILESISSEGTSPENTQSVPHTRGQAQKVADADDETPTKRQKRG